jgi:hypothetical protein
MRTVELRQGGQPALGSAAGLLPKLSREASAAADHVMPRRPGGDSGRPRDVAKCAAQEVLFHAAARAGDRLAWLAASKGHATLGAGLGSASAVLGGVGAGLSALAALKWGFERIIEAHQRAHEQDVRWHLARGLAVTLALGLEHPDREIGAVREEAIRRARRDHEQAAIVDRLRRNGQSWPADRRRRRGTMAGWRAGMQAGLRLLARLDPGQRLAIRREIVAAGGELERSLQAAAGAAIAAGGR